MGQVDLRPKVEEAPIAPMAHRGKVAIAFLGKTIWEHRVCTSTGKRKRA